MVRPGIVAINGSARAAVVAVWVSNWSRPHVSLHMGAIALDIAMDADLSLSLHSND